MLFSVRVNCYKPPVMHSLPLNGPHGHYDMEVEDFHINDE